MQNTVIRFKNWDLVVWLGQQPADALVAVKPIAEAIGLDWKSQHRKVAVSPTLKCGHMTIVAEDGKLREMLCIPAMQVARWLLSISPGKVKPELKEKLIQFQDECMYTIYEAISGKVTPERMYNLEAQMKDMAAATQALSSEVVELRAELKAERERNDRLQEESEWVQGRYSMEASYNGRSLGSMRKDRRPSHLRVVNGLIN